MLAGVFKNLSLGRLLLESESVAVVLSGVRRLLAISLADEWRKLSSGSDHVTGNLLEPEPGLEVVDHAGVALADVSRLVRRMLSRGFLLSLGPGLIVVEVVKPSMVVSWKVLGAHLVPGNLLSGTGILKLVGDTMVISADGELVLPKVGENMLNLSWRGLQEISVEVGIQILSSRGGLSARNGLVEVQAC